MKKPIDDISKAFKSSPLANKIPEPFHATVINLIQAIAWTQQGYCGGMVLTAAQYYQYPFLLPSGYSRTRDIPITEATTTGFIVANQWITQFLADDFLLKFLLLRLGDGLCGLVPTNDEIDWILRQLDQQKVVKLTLIDPSLQWYQPHAVLAYAYESDGDDVYLKIYGPNLGNTAGTCKTDAFGRTYCTDSEGGQTIHLTKAGGSYAIVGGVSYVEGLAITRLGSEEGPTGVWTWISLIGLAHLGEVVSYLTDYLIQEGVDLLTFEAASPVNILVTTPDGLRVGYVSAADSVVNEAEDAMYSGPGTEPQAIVLPLPSPGVYAIDIYGTGAGSYAMTARSAREGSVIDSEMWTDTASPGEVARRSIQLFEDGTFDGDRSPPSTTLTIGNPKYIDTSDYIFVTSDTSFTLTAEDNLDGSGVATSAYRVFSYDHAAYDTGWTPVTPPTSFSLTEVEDGRYRIAFYSTDNAGNIETTHVVTVLVDNSAPKTNVTIGEPTYVNPQSNMTYVTPSSFLFLDAMDLHSGLHTISYRISNTTYDTGWLPYAERFSLNGLTNGNYTLTYYSTDNVGNAEPTRTATLTLVRAHDCPGDVNGDGKCNLFDIVAMTRCYSLSSQDEGWNPLLDFTGDSVINIYDLVTCASLYKP